MVLGNGLKYEAKRPQWTQKQSHPTWGGGWEMVPLVTFDIIMWVSTWVGRAESKVMAPQV